jgi:hypothetical protein
MYVHLQMYSMFQLTVKHQWNMITIQMYKTTPEKHDHNTDGQNNTRETWSQYRWILWSCFSGVVFVHLYCDHVSLVLFCPPVLWSCFTGVVLSICIVIMFLWCCFVHLYCDHVSLVLFRWTKTTPVKHDHNTDGQNNTRKTWSQYRCTKQHQRNMITIQVDKTTPEKHDHKYCDLVSLVLFCTSVLWSCFSDVVLWSCFTGVVLSICILIMFLWYETDKTSLRKGFKT